MWSSCECGFPPPPPGPPPRLGNGAARPGAGSGASPLPPRAGRDQVGGEGGGGSDTGALFGVNFAGGGLRTLQNPPSEPGGPQGFGGRQPGRAPRVQGGPAVLALRRSWRGQREGSSCKALKFPGLCPCISLCFLMYPPTPVCERPVEAKDGGVIPKHPCASLEIPSASPNIPEYPWRFPNIPGYPRISLGIPVHPLFFPVHPSERVLKRPSWGDPSL